MRRGLTLDKVFATADHGLNLALQQLIIPIIRVVKFIYVEMVQTNAELGVTV
jgi:hypothetical protein